MPFCSPKCLCCHLPPPGPICSSALSFLQAPPASFLISAPSLCVALSLHLHGHCWSFSCTSKTPLQCEDLSSHFHSVPCLNVPSPCTPSKPDLLYAFIIHPYPSPLQRNTSLFEGNREVTRRRKV